MSRCRRRWQGSGRTGHRPSLRATWPESSTTVTFCSPGAVEYQCTQSRQRRCRKVAVKSSVIQRLALDVRRAANGVDAEPSATSWAGGVRRLDAVGIREWTPSLTRQTLWS